MDCAMVREKRKEETVQFICFCKQRGCISYQHASLSPGKSKKTGSVQDFKQPVATSVSINHTVTPTPTKKKKKEFAIIFKRNICYFRGLHPMSH